MTTSNDHQRARLILACAGAFLAFLDATIVNIAFPSIAASFPGHSLDDLSWTLNSYNIAFTALLLPAGRLSDVFGAARTFAVGVGLFTAASLLCGLTTGLWYLVAARGVQAMGAALLVPASLSLLLATLRVAQRGEAIAVLGGVAALASGLGPALGGFLVEGAGWRAIFLVNVPVGLVTVLAALRLPNEKGLNARLPDVWTTLLAVLGIGGVAFGLTRSERWGWLDPRTGATLAVAALALVLLVRLSRSQPAAILPMWLMSRRSFASANVASAVLATAYFAAILTNALFLTTVWGYSVVQAGLALSVAPLTVMLAARPAARATDRYGYRAVIVCGVAIYVAGTLWLVVFAGSAPSFLPVWLPSAVGMGIGAAMAFPTLARATLVGLGASDIATAGSINAAFRQLGGVLGVALLVVVVGGSHTFLTVASGRRAWLFAAATAALTAVLALGLRGIRDVEGPTAEVAATPERVREP